MREEYSMLLSKSVKPEEDINRRIREVSFFKMFADNKEIIGKIAEMTTRKTVNMGKMLIEEGDYGDELYIILEGEIDIIKKTLQNEKYTVTTLHTDMGGIYVGELALIDNDRRSASVIAKTDCEFLVINRKDYLKFGDDNPKIGLQITREIASQLSAKLRKTNSDVITLFSALVEEIDIET